MSGIDWLGETGNNIGRLMPFLPREMFPFVPSAKVNVWLGPIENSFNRVGLIVLTQFKEKFQPGCFCVHPPGKLMEDEQAKMPNGHGYGWKGALSDSALRIQRP